MLARVGTKNSRTRHATRSLDSFTARQRRTVYQKGDADGCRTRQQHRHSLVGEIVLGNPADRPTCRHSYSCDSVPAHARMNSRRRGSGWLPGP